VTSLENARLQLKAAREMFVRRPSAYADGFCRYYERLVAKLEKERN
jgi:hypothetical protein